MAAQTGGFFNANNHQSRFYVSYMRLKVCLISSPSCYYCNPVMGRCSWGAVHGSVVRRESDPLVGKV